MADPANMKPLPANHPPSPAPPSPDPETDEVYSARMTEDLYRRIALAHRDPEILRQLQAELSAVRTALSWTTDPAYADLRALGWRPALPDGWSYETVDEIVGRIEAARDAQREARMARIRALGAGGARLAAMGFLNEEPWESSDNEDEFAPFLPQLPERHIEHRERVYRERWERERRGEGALQCFSESRGRSGYNRPDVGAPLPEDDVFGPAPRLAINQSPIPRHELDQPEPRFPANHQFLRETGVGERRGPLGMRDMAAVLREIEERIERAQAECDEGEKGGTKRRRRRRRRGRAVRWEEGRRRDDMKKVG